LLVVVTDSDVNFCGSVVDGVSRYLDPVAVFRIVSFDESPGWFGQAIAPFVVRDEFWVSVGVGWVGINVSIRSRDKLLVWKRRIERCRVLCRGCHF
jgi:hypothetical protein